MSQAKFLAGLQSVLAQENTEFNEDYLETQKTIRDKQGSSAKGRLWGSIGGALLGSLFGPAGMAIGSALGSRGGSEYGERNFNLSGSSIEDVELDVSDYKFNIIDRLQTADEVAGQVEGFDTQQNLQALSDAWSAYQTGSSKPGQAVGQKVYGNSATGDYFELFGLDLSKFWS